MKKAIIIGLDGFEPKIVEKMLKAGELPSLAELCGEGGYSRIRTTYPAQTPLRGQRLRLERIPGAMGIFDFIRRDPRTYLPDLALSNRGAIQNMSRAGLHFIIKLMTILTSVVVCALLSACGTAIGEQSQRVIESTEKGTLILSTYLGGKGEDTIRDIATDSLGNIYVTGGTASPDFQVTSGSFDSSFNGTMDVFVAKFDPSGSIIWATFIGGPNYDRGYGIEVDSTGVYVAGRAGMGFPTTAGVIQRTFAGDNDVNALYGPQDGFVAKLSLDGHALLWSTYLGGLGPEVVRDIAIDTSGNVYAAISDARAGFQHISAGAFDTTHNGGVGDGALVKINSTATAVVYGTYIGGSGMDGATPSVRVNASGEAFLLEGTHSTDMPVTPGCFQPTLHSTVDVFIAKLNATGSALIFGTYFGGNQVEFTETHGLAIDAAGNAYIAITTQSTFLPVTAGAFQSNYGGSGGSGTGGGTNYSGDVFVGKISADGTNLLAGTYLGGRYGEGAEGIAVDAEGNVYVSGATYSDNFPVTSDAFQARIVGDADLFVTKLTGDLRQLSYSSYIGGHSQDYGRSLAIDPVGNIYVAGMTKSANWPTGDAMQPSYNGDWDGALAKFTFAAFVPALLPRISSASVSGKKLFVIGENFGQGAEILLNDEKQNKTSNDLEKPTTMLVARKAGKKIALGDTVKIQVRNPDGSLSEIFLFTR